MTLYELTDKATTIGRKITSAHIPVYIDGVTEIEDVELSQRNNGNYYVNIKAKTKKSQRMISAKAKEALYSKPEDSLLGKALDFIVETQEDNDYICEKMSELDEWEYCENNCQNLNKECIKRFLKHYENNRSKNPTSAT